MNPPRFFLSQAALPLTPSFAARRATGAGDASRSRRLTLSALSLAMDAMGRRE